MSLSRGKKALFFSTIPSRKSEPTRRKSVSSRKLVETLKAMQLAFDLSITGAGLYVKRYKSLDGQHLANTAGLFSKSRFCRVHIQTLAHFARTSLRGLVTTELEMRVVSQFL